MLEPGQAVRVSSSKLIPYNGKTGVVKEAYLDDPLRYLVLLNDVPARNSELIYIHDELEPLSAEVRQTSETGGQKGSKLERYDLLPVDALAEVARLYGRGADKYAAHNYRKGYDWSLSYAALQRHANAFWSGENVDPELGRHHMAAVVFHALALIEYSTNERYSKFDDRYKEAA